MLKSMNLRAWLRSITIASLVLGVWGSSSAQEGLFNVRDLDMLSQFIVVGTITSGADGQLSLSVDKVIKGPTSMGPNLNVAWSPKQSSGCDTASPSTPTHGIWFLTKARNGSIQFASFMNSQLCHPSRPDYVVPAGPLSGGLFYEPLDTSRYKLAIELASALLTSTTMPVAVQRYPGIFGGLNTTEAESVGQVLEGSSSESIRMMGEMSMIRAGVPAELELLASSALELAQTPLAGTESNSVNGRATYKMQLADAISEIHSTTANSINILAQIATNKGQDLEVRRAASRALRNVHTPQAVVAIAPLLDDPDSIISTYALSALSCYANAVPVLDDTVPGHNLDLNQQGPFKSTDTLAHFVIGPMGRDAPEKKAYWEQWWESHQSLIQQAVGGVPLQ